MAASVKWKADVKAFVSSMRGMTEEIYRGLTLGLAAGAEYVNGEIKGKYLGNRVWTPVKKPSAPAWRMAMWIAKHVEHFTSFTHGRRRARLTGVRATAGTVTYVTDKRGRRRKVVKKTKTKLYAPKLPASPGWRRVVELAKQMPFDENGVRKYPSATQRIWMQTGELRKRMDWDIGSRAKRHRGRGVTGVPIGNNEVAKVLFVNPMDYAERLEEKYKPVQTAVQRAIENGSIMQRMTAALNQIRADVLAKRTTQ